MNAKKLTLIQQMLAKAESTTPEEAEALTEAAQKLMVKHGIDAAMIAAKKAADDKPEAVITDHIEFTGIYHQGLTSMGYAVLKAFGTMNAYKSSWKSTTRLYIVGFESDVKQTKLLIESLQLQATAAMSQWWRSVRTSDEPGNAYLRSNGSAGYKARRQFFISFGYGAAEKIKSFTQQAVAEDTTGSTALALRDRSKIVAEHMPSDLRAGRGIIGSAYGSSEGKAAGRTANVGQTGLGGGARGAIGR